jgi:transglutaminase-like putative cysteine protease
MKLILKYVLCLALFSCAIVCAEEDSLYQKAVDLCEQGDAAYENEQYREAIDAYLEALTYLDAEELKYEIYYHLGCSYSMLGEAPKAFEYLDSVLEAGHDIYYSLQQFPAFEFLRENHKKEFREKIKHAIDVRRKGRLQRIPLGVVAYDNYNGPLEIAEYDWEDLNWPEFDTLRNAYQLHKIIEDGKTEFEKMTRLLNWVATRWEHDGSNMAPDRSALAILREADKGKRFCCANYADVLKECMRALGYPARFVGLVRDVTAFETGGHGCVEVWSNQYQKWIMFDGQNNAWWEHDNVPLNAHECHRLYMSGILDELMIVGQHEHFDYHQLQLHWIAYFYRVTSYWMDTNYVLLSDSDVPELIVGKFPRNDEHTDDYEKVYPRINQTKITLRIDPEGPLDSLNIDLDHTMPYFDRFLVRINEMEWKEAEETFPWVLNEGENMIEAKAVNAVGIEGRPSRIVLQNNHGLPD